jgi:protein-S-isoprenylcysteine O-methyltransferase Ste14
MSGPRMSRVARNVSFVLFGGLSSLLSLASFGAFALWISGRHALLSVDAGPVRPALATWLPNTLWMVLLCGYHSGAVRPRVKQWLLRFIPQPIERSVYNLLSSLLFLLLMWAWRPAPTPLWSVGARYTVLMDLVFTACWAALFLGIWLIHPSDFFGLRQVGLGLQGRPYAPPAPRPGASYVLARIPLMLGLVLIPWTTPTMTAGHLYFAVFMTAYCVVGSVWSKRDHDLTQQQGRAS